MIQGTTPTHVFELPFDISAIKAVKVVYEQGNEIILEKGNDNCTLIGNTVEIKLTQEETFLFKTNEFVKIQIRILTFGGQALTSVPETVTVGKCLDKEVLE